MTREERFMQQAIQLSEKSVSTNGGGPFGCVIVKGDQIIGQGYNKVTFAKDPTAHAEIVAIREACKYLNHHQLSQCEIYTSCEPCPMCLGAIYWARPAIVYFANTRNDASTIGFDDSFIYQQLLCNIDSRKIPMVALGRHEAIKVFEQWKKKEDKQQY